MIPLFEVRRLAGIIRLLLVGMTVGASIVSATGAFAQGHNYEPIGCYYNTKGDKRLWAATIGLTPKALDRTFYEDPGFGVIMRAGDNKYNIDGKEIIVHLMKDFNYAGAEKFKFMKYSLVIDY